MCQPVAELLDLGRGKHRVADDIRKILSAEVFTHDAVGCVFEAEQVQGFVYHDAGERCSERPLGTLCQFGDGQIEGVCVETVGSHRAGTGEAQGRAVHPRHHDEAEVGAWRRHGAGLSAVAHRPGSLHAQHVEEAAAQVRGMRHFRAFDPDLVQDDNLQPLSLGGANRRGTDPDRCNYPSLASHLVLPGRNARGREKRGQ